MTGIDVIVVIIMLGSALIAFLRGFIKEVLTIGAWIGATFITLYGFAPVQAFASRFIPVEMIANAAAGAGLYVVSLAILSVISHHVSKRVKDSTLSAIDRSLGVLFGLLRGAALLGVAYLSISWIYPQFGEGQQAKESKTLFLVKGSATIMMAVLPDDLLQSTRKMTETPEKTPSENLIDSLVQKKEKKPDEKTENQGYLRRERSDLDRLINSTE